MAGVGDRALQGARSSRGAHLRPVECRGSPLTAINDITVCHLLLPLI